jgi:SAM-dependent methyltransferase
MSIEPPSQSTERAHAERFDAVSKEYIRDLNRNLALAGGDSLYFYQAKVQLIRSLLAGAPPRAILDFGCGIGFLSRLLADEFPAATIMGLDPSAESLKVARKESRRYGDRVRFYDNLDDVELDPDFVVAAGVLHHIGKDHQQKNISQIFTRLKPGGQFAVFEHNPLNPATRLIVALAKVDRGACLIAPWRMKAMFRNAAFSDVKLEYVSFFPPRFTALLKAEKYLTALPLGAQYLAYGRRK